MVGYNIINSDDVFYDARSYTPVPPFLQIGTSTWIAYLLMMRGVEPPQKSLLALGLARLVTAK